MNRKILNLVLTVIPVLVTACVAPAAVPADSSDAAAEESIVEQDPPNPLSPCSEGVVEGQFPSECMDLEGDGYARANIILGLGGNCNDAFAGFDTVAEWQDGELQAYHIPDDPEQSRSARYQQMRDIIDTVNSDFEQSACIASFDYVIDGDGHSTFGSPGMKSAEFVDNQHPSLGVGFTEGEYGLDTRVAISHSGQTGTGVNIYLFDSFCEDMSALELEGSYLEIRSSRVQTVKDVIHAPLLCTHGESVFGMAARMAPQATYIGIPVLDHNAVGYLSGLVDGLWSVRNELKEMESARIPVVMNFSLGVRVEQQDRVDPEAHIHLLYEVLHILKSDAEEMEKGIVFVAAVGNANRPEPDLPAGYGFVLGVTSTKGDGSGDLATYPNQGYNIAAPGGDAPINSDGIRDCAQAGHSCLIVLNSHYSNRTGLWGGTSFAAPIVSGAAAILLELNPSMTTMDMWHVIVDHADSRRNQMLDVANSLINMP
ncbi:S8 family serine peptidase [Chloroflexi bacterium TSY]|nr:S8 family serine peptidase [Chloroflexi bacterium TSY]